MWRLDPLAYVIGHDRDQANIDATSDIGRWFNFGRDLAYQLKIPTRRTFTNTEFNNLDVGMPPLIQGLYIESPQLGNFNMPTDNLEVFGIRIR